VRLYEQARQAGEQAIRDGRVAAFLVAGGQGTRLGFDGPKGAFRSARSATRTLFQLFAEYLLGVQRRWVHRPRWYIMTSLANDQDTRAFFAAHGHFGLDPADVMFFRQGQMPAFLPTAGLPWRKNTAWRCPRTATAAACGPWRPAAPSRNMRQRGIDTISYFQVDNPLVHVLDPLFIGLHLVTGSEMSSKAIPKAYDTERVGNFCRVDGKVAVIEYSDLPEALALARNADGSRRFDAGSNRDPRPEPDVCRAAHRAGALVQLPWHRADKKVPVVDDAGRPFVPDQPNAVKLEMFVFDAIRWPANPLVLFTRREEEFKPGQNAEGVDSPATARRDLSAGRPAGSEHCGISVPRGGEGAIPATGDQPRFRARRRRPPHANSATGPALQQGAAGGVRVAEPEC